MPRWKPETGSRPPVRHVDELIDLGQIGHIRAIQDKLDEIGNDCPEHADFVSQMRTLVDRFDLDRYMATLETLHSMITESKKRDIVLVVDNSPETLRMLTDAIEDAGMTVLVARDGAAAMSIVDRMTPDVILMDAVMPGLDGFETCRRLKRDAGLAHVPIIFMTGLTETEHIVQGLEAGGVDYVTKPIVPDELLARIRVHLANARLTHSARTALDVSGRFLLAVDGVGKILWARRRRRNCCRNAQHRLRPRRRVARPDPGNGWTSARKAKAESRAADRDPASATSSSGCPSWAAHRPATSTSSALKASRHSRRRRIAQASLA